MKYGIQDFKLFNLIQQLRRVLQSFKKIVDYSKLKKILGAYYVMLDIRQGWETRLAIYRHVTLYLASPDTFHYK